MESAFHVHAVLDERLTRTRVSAVHAAVRLRPAIRLESIVPTACAIVCVVPELDSPALEIVHATAQRAACPILVLSCATPDPDGSMRALGMGASDVLCGERFDALFDAILARAERIAEVEAIVRSPLVQEHLCGGSKAWLAILRELITVARFSDVPILLLGETGTGKELLARLAHTLDRRPDKRDLLVVDCTTLTPELAASELFGHERGAFTGSVATRRGAVAEADHGTLFLDEVGDLPLGVQAALLRTLQEGSYKPLGSDHWRQARFRLICATHRDLAAAVEEGRFRSDFYFRIASCVLSIPPLRERQGDIGVLADAFLREFGCSAGADETVHRLLTHSAYPGNVRELRRMMQSAAREHGGHGPVSVGCLPRAWLERLDRPCVTTAAKDATDHVGGAEALIRVWLDEGLGLQEIAQRAGDVAIRLALDLEGNHLGRASRRLRVTERAIQLRRTRRATSASHS